MDRLVTSLSKLMHAHTRKRNNLFLANVNTDSHFMFFVLGKGLLKVIIALGFGSDVVDFYSFFDWFTWHRIFLE